jgi:flagellin
MKFDGVIRMTSINTNISATVAANALTKNERAMGSAMERLSTGLRINSSRDDAAGLAVSSRMSAQISGLNQAVRNANDAISLLQTAEGATIEISNMLQRMRELAVQSASDSNASSDRAYLDLEYQQLMKEITRVAESTEWNGMNILNNTDVGTSTAVGAGTGRAVAFQVGANANQTFSVTLKDLSFSTGSDATAGEYQFNIAADDFSTADAIEFTITRDGTATAFNVTGITAPSATATAAEVTTLAAEIATHVNNTVGFQNVQVTAVGTTISIVDGEGGVVSAFDATAAGVSLAVPAGALSEVVAGVSSSVAADPATANSAAVFGGTARLNDTDLTSTANSNTAIQRLDVAINSLNEERATFGSVMSRLTFAADNLANVAQNTEASRSRILDADYAKETTELARTQIIAQAGTAMLAQANQVKQSVLALLQ